MKIIADIAPVPLARYRVNTHNKGRFLPTKSGVFRQVFATIAKAQFKRDLFTGALKISIHFYKPKKITSRVYGDIDNLEKAILDALNGVIWEDDGQIIEMHSFKHYGTPKIEIDIEEAD